MFIFFNLLILLWGDQALAHNVWINPSNHFPGVGDTVDIEIAWGHTYPANRLDQTMKQGNLAYIKIFDPEGETITPVTVSETRYKLAIQKQGAYLVTAGIKPGVFTKTPEGRKWCDKRGVSQAITCTSYAIEAKTVILAGDSAQHIDRTTGQDLEIIPLGDPLNLKPGKPLFLQVLFKGKPVPEVTVNGTFAGFEQEKEGPDAASHSTGNMKKHRFPVSVVTDKEGKAQLTLDRTGYWMALISHKTPYPDTNICDEYMNNMALTFQVR